ncbi:MAG: SMI1/KNR4 family protein [Gemmataceae bacterium]
MMKSETWDLLDREFSKFPIMKSTPVSRAEIEAAAEELGQPFHEDYIEFVSRYGGAMVGPYPIYGLRKPEVMGLPGTVTAVTKNFRTQRWPGTDGWYVISEDGFGNPIGASQDGTIWISDHDSGGVSKVATDLEHYLRTRCLRDT